MQYHNFTDIHIYNINLIMYSQLRATQILNEIIIQKKYKMVELPRKKYFRTINKLMY